MNKANERIELFFDRLIHVKEYADNVINCGAELTEGELDNKDELVRELFEIGSSFELSPREIVVTMLRPGFN